MLHEQLLHPLHLDLRLISKVQVGRESTLHNVHGLLDMFLDMELRLLQSQFIRTPPATRDVQPDSDRVPEAKRLGSSQSVEERVSQSMSQSVSCPVLTYIHRPASYFLVRERCPVDGRRL